MADTTTIEVSRETWRKLNAFKHPGDSFDDAVNRVIKQASSGGPAEQLIDDPGDEPIDVDDVDVPGTGQILGRRRAAVHLMAEEIHKTGGATKGELLELVDVEELGYQDPESAWKNCFHPALQELEAVEAAGTSGLWLPT